jgi:hypothetical protein
MKKELTIEHLAAYLPYILTVKKNKCHHILEGLTGRNYAETRNGMLVTKEQITNVIPLLRPLSQLTETIEHGGKRFIPLDWIHDNTPIKAVLCTDTKGRVGLWCDNIKSSHYNAWPHSLVRTLLHMHFDVYGLIDSGLAEPIPSIEQP